MPFHLLLDAARMDDSIDLAKSLNPSHASLYRRRDVEEEMLPAVAPYLFTYPQTPEFEDFILVEGWGNAWGLWVESDANFETLYRHFRRFLTVQMEDGKELYFRFYDPRVLRIFLPTCDFQQLSDFFGPVNQFIMEDDDPALCVIFSLWNNQLFVDRQEAAHIRFILASDSAS